MAKPRKPKVNVVPRESKDPEAAPKAVSAATVTRISIAPKVQYHQTLVDEAAQIIADCTGVADAELLGIYKEIALALAKNPTKLGVFERLVGRIIN